MNDHAPEIVMDARGFYWRRYPDMLSMVPVTSDNERVPEPFVVYRPVETPTFDPDILARELEQANEGEKALRARLDRYAHLIAAKDETISDLLATLRAEQSKGRGEFRRGYDAGKALLPSPEKEPTE